MKKFAFLALVLTVSITIFALKNYSITGIFNSKDFTIDATMIVFDVDSSELHFSLYPNLYEKGNPKISSIAQSFSQGYIKIKSIIADGENLKYEITSDPDGAFQTYSTEHTLLVVRNPKLYKKISISFKLKIPEGPAADESCWAGACIWRFGWYPLLKETSEGVVYPPHICKVNIKTPKDWKFVTFEGAGLGCPLGILKGYKSFSVEGKYYKVNVYYKRGRKERAQNIAAIALNSLDKLSKRFGDIDYNVINIIESPVSGTFGMTTNGFVILGDGVFTTADLWIPGFFNPLYEFLILHELSHLWFGVGATVIFTEDNFLSESLAQYSSITEIEKEYGEYINLYDKDTPDIASSVLEDMLLFKSLRENYLYLYRQMHRLGIDTSIAGESDLLNQDFPKNYAKGYFAMRTLALYFDDFDKVLKEYYKVFNHRIVTYEDFRNFLETQKSGAGKLADLLFLSKSGIDAKILDKGDSLYVDIEPGIPYEIKLTTPGGEEKVEKLTKPAVISKENLLSVEVDPHWFLPDPDRFNNSYPPKIYIPFSEQMNTPDSTKVVSPLEAYLLDFPNITLTMTDNEILISYTAGIRKFDEWGFYIGGSSYYNQTTQEQIPLKSISGSFFLSPNPYIYLEGYGNIDGDFSSLSLESINKLSLNGGFSIPEKLDIGYTTPYLYTRNYFDFSFEYKKDYLPLISGIYTYWDLIKLPVLAQIGTSYYWGAGFIPFGFLDWIFNEYLDLKLEGLYSTVGDLIITTLNATETLASAFGMAGLGLHLNIDLEDRINIYNFASLRGLVLSIQPSMEAGMVNDNLVINPVLTLGAMVKFYQPLDALSGLGFYIKIYFDESGNYKGSFLQVGYDITDYIITAYRTAIPPFAPSHPREPQNHFVKPVF